VALAIGYRQRHGVLARGAASGRWRGVVAENIWQGRLVRLRAVEPADWEAFFAWADDTEGQRRSYQIPFPPSATARRRDAEQTALAPTDGDQFRWAIADHDGTLIGTINTHSCDRRNGVFRYGLGIRQEYQRRGYAREAILLALRYFFGELRYQKVGALVYSFNTPSISLHERLGFQQEGRLRREIFTAGQYHDVVIFGLTVEEFTAQHPEYAPAALS
jgi:RimJ/RimL family protein N-acetyltransferase